MSEYEPRRRREKLAENLRERREDAGLSRKELADRSGLSYPYVSQLETGDREPSMEALGKLAAGLGVDAAELISGSDSAIDLAMQAAPPPPAAAGVAPAAPVAASASSRGWLPNPGFSRSAPSAKTRRKDSGDRVAQAVDEAYAALSLLPPKERLDAAGAVLARCMRDAAS